MSQIKLFQLWLLYALELVSESCRRLFQEGLNGLPWDVVWGGVIFHPEFLSPRLLQKLNILLYHIRRDLGGLLLLLVKYHIDLLLEHLRSSLVVCWIRLFRCLNSLFVHFDISVKGGQLASTLAALKLVDRVLPWSKCLFLVYHWEGWFGNRRWDCVSLNFFTLLA